MGNYRQPFIGEYPITQRFGETYTNPKGHTGIDYACPIGTRILASADGQVFFADYDNTGYGYTVMLRHSDGRQTLYAHLSFISVKPLETVQQGDLIGFSGWSGNVYPAGEAGAHLHFEIRENGKPVDPMLLMQSVDDSVVQKPDTSKPISPKFVEPEELGENVKIVAPLGAWGWALDFNKRKTVFPYGEKLHFTGRTIQRLDYTYCECYPEPITYWVAVHDKDTQIIDNE